MCAVGAILSLPANKRSSIQVVVLIDSISALQVEAYASKSCLGTADPKKHPRKESRHYAVFMPIILKLEQAECRSGKARLNRRRPCSFALPAGVNSSRKTSD